MSNDEKNVLNERNRYFSRSYVKLKYLKENENIVKTDSSADHPITIGHLFLGIMAWIIGSALSGLFFCAELFPKKYDHHLRSRQAAKETTRRETVFIKRSLYY